MNSLTTVDISLLASSIGVSGSVLVACLLWIYRELNSLRADIANFRVEVAQQYVNTRALKEVEQRLENALEKLGIRFDRALDRAEKALVIAVEAKTVTDEIERKIK